jgi:hypothetical protein
VPDHLKEDRVQHGAHRREPAPDGYIDIEAAYKQYVDDVRDAEMNAWRSTKQRSVRVSGGTAGHPDARTWTTTASTTGLDGCQKLADLDAPS